MTWKLVDCFYETNKLSQHQIDSYNIFIENNIQSIINNVGNIDLIKDNVIDGCIEFGNISINLPIHSEADGQVSKITPHEARLRNLTYSSSLFIDIKYKSKNNVELFNNCFIGKIPIMIKSNIDLQTSSEKECTLDQGGYFIVSGSEKVLISQEKMNNNQIYIFENNKQIESEIRSLSENDMKSTSTIKMHISKTNDYDNKLKIQLPFLKSDIPALYVFHAMGKNYSDYIDMYDNDIKEFLLFSEIDLEEAITIPLYCEKKLNIKSIISNEKKSYILNENFSKNFFPHCSTVNEKLFLYGLMITKTVNCFLKKKSFDDRDHYKNKRIDTAGDLLSFLFKQLYKKLHKDMSTAAQKNYEQNRILNIAQLIKSKIITNGMKYSLATGNWGMSSNQGIKVGISQVLNRHSYMSTLSHLRRINSPIGKDGKVTLPRQLHGSHAYRICPCETPEGQQCGLVKNMALTCIISQYTYSDTIKNIIFEIDNIIFLDEKYSFNLTKIMVNGNWIVSTSEPETVINILKNRRKFLDISSHVGLCFDKLNNEIRVHTDSGRCLRPLVIVENGKSNLTSDVLQKIKKYDWKWNDLIVNGVIEYIDSDEEESLLIAFDDNDIINRKIHFTHCEIDKALMLGICASLIPFSDHNQAPRNVYQSAMGKQAMGLYATNYQERIDSFSHVLHYPQKPLVKTDTMDTFQFENMPSGVNAIVAIACYGGQNQEDSVIMNQSSIDRGLFRSSFYRTYKDEQKQQGVSNKEAFEKPDKNVCLGMSLGDYSKIDNDGLSSPGSFVNENDIIIGKTTTIQNDEKGYNKKDTSTSLRHNEQGVIDKVMITSNEHGVCMTKTRVRSIRIPEMGDKFCGDDKFDVLTNNGWKAIADVTKNDTVATLNPDTHIIEYQNVEETYKFEHKGDMYRIKSQQIDLYTTLNHKMYVKQRRKTNFELIEAKYIYQKRVSYKKNGINNNRDYQFTLDDKTSFDMNIFLQFFGFWIADGWANKYTFKRKNRKSFTTNHVITICKTKPHTREWIINIIKQLGLHPCFHNNDKINISHKVLAKYLTTLSVGATNKFLPSWVWNLSETQSQTLLKGLILGDGNISNSKSWIYFTSSIQLRDDIQKLCFQAGWSASYKKCQDANVLFTIRNKQVKTNAISWRLNINKTKNEPTVNHGHVHEQNIQEEYIENFDGYVYCILVPNHIFYVRRNGIPVWTGNSSRHGQKGTIGITLRQEDMPFTAEGIVPDIIINPHAIPSRMTVAQLIECVTGKCAALNGNIRKATTFSGNNPEVICEELKNCGYDKRGREVMYSGLTGKQLDAEIFIGPTYYQRLKHMVHDKVHSRARGPVQLLTRQPVEGRSKEGGLRFGEMERDCIISHGAAGFLKERLMDVSDSYTTCVCKICGLMAVKDKQRNIMICKGCKTSNGVEEIKLPYACKLLFQELMSINIAPRIKL